MAAARSSLRAAAMETRVRACGEKTLKMEKIDKPACSVRVYGSMIITRHSRKIGDTRTRWEHDEVPPDSWKFDHRMEVKEDPSFFRSYVACRDLIHRMLAEGPGTGKCDLAADNWESFQPHDTATTIVDEVRRDADEDACGVVVPAYAFDIEMDLDVSLTYSEPKALLLACKEAQAADASARGRKRRRGERAGELCAVCLSKAGTKGEEAVRLPCSHVFHDRCILPWFYRASTCPACRRDAMEHFDFVRAASAWASFTYREPVQATTATSAATTDTSNRAAERQPDNTASATRSKRVRRPNPRYE